jgi:heptosyltransferase-2/heptosyltransferase-3
MHPIVIRFGRLGDMLLLAPLLERLHRGYDNPCLLLGTGPWSLPLYASHPDVAGVIQVNSRHQPLAFSPQRWQMLHALRAHQDAAVHVCEVEPRALAKIRRMLTIAQVPSRRCVYLSDAPVLADEHWIERLLRGCGHPPDVFASAWHSPAPSNAVAPRLYLRDEDRRDCDTWLRARGWRGERIWLVQPLNRRSVRWNGPRDQSDDDKAWPVQHWIASLRAIHADDPDARTLLCGAPREASMLEAMAAGTRSRGVDPVARDLPLRRLMALCEIACGMLSVDTGPAHVAAAMGCPLVVLFGAQSPWVWCPRSPTGSAVIALGGPPRCSSVRQITPGEVVAALRSLPVREPHLPDAA